MLRKKGGREERKEAETRKQRLSIWISSAPKGELVAHSRSLSVLWLQTGTRRHDPYRFAHIFTEFLWMENERTG